VIDYIKLYSKTLIFIVLIKKKSYFVFKCQALVKHKE